MLSKVISFLLWILVGLGIVFWYKHFFVKEETINNWTQLEWQMNLNDSNFMWSEWNMDNQNFGNLEERGDKPNIWGSSETKEDTLNQNQIESGDTIDENNNILDN